MWLIGKFQFLCKHKRHVFVMLEYAGTLLTIDHFKDRCSWCFSFISHIYLERLCHLYIIYYGRIPYVCNNASWSPVLLVLNIPYLGLLMLKQCICKLCPEFDTGRLEGMLIWFYSYMALYLQHCFSLISWCVNW